MWRIGNNCGCLHPKVSECAVAWKEAGVAAAGRRWIERWCVADAEQRGGETIYICRGVLYNIVILLRFSSR